MSITPAFSPGPWITQGALVGRPRRWMREDLYEQCSFHIAEKMPSSVKVGTRPISLRRRSYSSGLRPWAATSAGVILGCWALGFRTGGVFVRGVLVGAGFAVGFVDAAFRTFAWLGVVLAAFLAV